MQPKNKTASVIVGIIAVLLILGGVFLLNQSFNNKNNSSDTSSSSPSSVSVSSSRSSSLSSSSLSSTSSLSSSSKTSSTSSSSKSSSSTSSTGLATGQVVIKVNTVNTSGGYDLEITDSSFASSKYFKTGAKLNGVTITGIKIEAGKSYKVEIDFTEDATSFEINTLKILSEV